MAAWNALFIIAGLLLIALVGEGYLRLANPFIESGTPYRFVDGVGLQNAPNAELRFANWHDNHFAVSHTNSQGFLDREPVSAERAAAGCHIAFIGDSFVEARQQPITDKFHVRLEKMAARELPHLSITTQAYGMDGTGQINQLPYYDEYARLLNPNLLVLIFYVNDFSDNSTALLSLYSGLDPDRIPFMSAQRDAYGNMKLRPPDAEYERFLLPRLPQPWHKNAWNRLVKVSYLAKWLSTKYMRDYGVGHPQLAAWAEMIAARPCCVSLLNDWQPVVWWMLDWQFGKEHMPPVFEDALEYTAFGIDQFKRRLDRDGVNLAILAATRIMGTRGDPQFDRLSAIADARGIPVISDYDYNIRQGHDAANGQWRNDLHWNATGHQWVAEALLEWLKENQDVCG